ncbi:hypothetical protein Tco_0104733 [Tanacetum coccineum]
MLRGLDQLMERKECGGMYLLWVSLIGDVRTLMMDEAHASRYLVNSGADKTYYDLRDMYGGHVWRRILLPILELKYGDTSNVGSVVWKEYDHVGKNRNVSTSKDYVGDHLNHKGIGPIAYDLRLSQKFKKQ